MKRPRGRATTKRTDLDREITSLVASSRRPADAEQADEGQFRSRLDQMPAGDEPWLRYAGAAKVLGISRGTLEVWLSTKRYSVPFFKIGRNVLFRRSELLAWIESRRRGGDAV